MIFRPIYMEAQRFPVCFHQWCRHDRQQQIWQAGGRMQEPRRGLVARLIGSGNNWPLGSICLMGGIGNQSHRLFGSIPCNSSKETSLSDALRLSCILLSDHARYEWLCVCRRSVNNQEILKSSTFGKSHFKSIIVKCLTRPSLCARHKLKPGFHASSSPPRL